jgi:Reverse transcriptase (RNA-dependent DNA polymerase)
MHTFGEIGNVYENQKIKSKLRNKGFPCIFIGYYNMHGDKLYKFYNIQTTNVFLSRNVVWLNKMYSDWMNTKSNPISPSDSPDESFSLTDMIPCVESLAHNHPPYDHDVHEPKILNRSLPLHLALVPMALVEFFANPDPMAHMETGNIVLIHPNITRPVYPEALYMAVTPDMHLFPLYYDSAMKHTDNAHWWEAMVHEFDNLSRKGAFKISKKSNLQKGRKIIGNQWVYARKDDSRYGSRTVAKGFSQIPGKDLHENHAPVVHDTTFRMILVAQISYKLSSRHFDIETAFLYGKLEEEIYMQFPEEYEEYSSNTHFVLLLKALYGLVQAARQWWRKITEVFAKLDLFPTQADPCLFVRKLRRNELPAYIILYVDDGGIIGTPQIIQEGINSLKQDFMVKDLGPIEHFVGCHLLPSKDTTIIWIHQSKLLKYLEDFYRTEIRTSKVYKIPAAPKTVFMRPQEGDATIPNFDQSKYRSGVGMLLFLVKHSRQDLANSVRELTKVLDGATLDYWKGMVRVINYVLGTRIYALKLKPTIDLKYEKRLYLE